MPEKKPKKEIKPGKNYRGILVLLLIIIIPLVFLINNEMINQDLQNYTESPEEEIFSDVVILKRYGFITGNKINLREEPKIADNIIVLLYEGEEVEILEQKYDDVGISNTYTCNGDVVLSTEEAPYSIKLRNGKAVKVVNEYRCSGKEFYVEVEYKEKKIYGCLSSKKLEKMNYPWYKIMDDEGNIGWLYGKFVEIELDDSDEITE